MLLCLIALRTLLCIYGYTPLFVNRTKVKETHSFTYQTLLCLRFLLQGVTFGLFKKSKQQHLLKPNMGLSRKLKPFAVHFSLFSEF